jgi:hypothetical protein
VAGVAVTYRFGHAFFRQTLYDEMIARVGSGMLIPPGVSRLYYVQVYRRPTCAAG